MSNTNTTTSHPAASSLTLAQLLNIQAALVQHLAAFESTVDTRISSIYQPQAFPQQVAGNGSGVVSYGAASASAGSSVSSSDVSGMVSSAVQSALSALSNLTATNLTATNATATTLHVTGATTLDTPLGISSGGTGTSSAPTYGQIPVGNASGGYTYMSTSSLNLTAAFSGAADFSAATSSVFAITSAPSTLLKTNALGQVTSAIAGVDYALPGTGSFGYLFPGNATTTTVGFNGGLSASSITAGNATSSSLAITGVPSALLKTTVNGSVVPAIAGVDYATPSALFGYLFPGNATSTKMSFNGGLTTTNATSSSFAITNVASSLLKTTANGSVVPAIAGTDYLTSALLSFGPQGQQQSGANVTLASSTNGTDFSITGSGNIVTFNLPSASTANRGLLSTSDWNLFNGKQAALTFSYPLINAGNTVSLGFGTTTNNTWSGTNVFNANVTLTNATSTSLAVTNVSNAILKTNGNGSIIPATPGVDYQNYAYPFAGNATSTLIGFNGGLSASNINATGLTGTTLTATNATSTSLAVTSLSNSLLKVNANGSVVPAIGGVDYALPSSIFGYVFPGNATTTSIGFNGGLTASTLTASNATSSSFAITSVTSSLLKTNANGSVVPAVAGTDYLTSLSGAASSTLLSDTNTWTGSNSFGHASFGQATSTSLAIASLSNALLKVNANGSVVPAIGGVDYALPSSIFGYVFPGNATTTSIGFNGGLTASSVLATNATTTNFNIGGIITGAGLSNCDATTGKLLYNAATGQFYCGTDAGSSGVGINALGAQYSTPQGGATQVLATSSDTNLGLVITSNSNMHTFTPTWSGVLAVSRGGTGLNTVAAGALLYGNGTNALATTTSGTNGQILALLNGVPTWTASTTYGAGLSYNSGTVSLDTTGNWAGTLSGLSASQIIGMGFSTTSASYFLGQTGAASSTLLADNNMWSGNNVFNGLSANNLSLNLASTLLKTDASGHVVPAVAGTDYLTSLSGAASSTLLADSNTWSGNNAFTGHTSLDQATSTSLAIASLSNALLKVNASGSVIPAISGIDYVSPSALFGYLFPGNATTTSVGFNGGLTASTIGATAINAINATSSNFAITNVTGALLKTDVNGNVVPAVVGVDFASPSAATFGYLFPGGATSTQLAFNGGLTATSISAANATSTSFAVTSLSNSLLKVNASGSIVPAVAGTDYASPSSLFGYLFPGDATTTSIGFNGGLTATNVSTNGLTLSGSGLSSTLLKTDASGNVVPAVAGSDYQTPLSFSYPFTTAANTVSLAFGTTTANTWSNTNTFSGPTVLNGTLSVGNLSGPLQASNGSVSATSSIGVLYGGTGLSSAPSNGQMLLGQSNGTYALVSTSSLGILVEAPVPSAQARKVSSRSTIPAALRSPLRRVSSSRKMATSASARTSRLRLSR